MKRFASIAMAALLAAGALRAQTNSAADMYQEALYAQESMGDLPRAISLYKTILDRYAADPAIAPMTLLQLAACYQKQGKPDAVDAYRRILDRFAGSDAAVVATRRLAEMERAAPQLTLRQVWSGSEADTSGRVAKDGTYLTFTDWTTGDLMVRELPSGRISRVTSNGKGNDQFAETSIPSPDGRRIAYAWYHDNVYDIRVIPKGGGQPKVLYTTKNRGWLEPYDWSPDGRVLLALIVGPAMPNTLAAISVDDGTVTRVKEWDGNQGGRAAFSPDGRFIAFDSSSRGPQQERDVFVMPAAGGTETAILKHPADDRLMDWFPSGDRLLIRSDRAGTYGLWSIPIVNGVLKGDPIQVRSNLGVVFPGGFTKSGEYFYDVFENQSEVHVATLDPATGKLAGNPVPTEGRFIGLKTQATWSPDGESLAYGQLTPGGRGSTTLAVHTLRTGDVRTYPITLNNFQNPTWNPDGTAIVVQGRNSAGEQGLHRVDLQKGTIAPLMPLAPPSGSSSGESPLGKGQPVFSPDGKRVFFIVAAGSQGVWARDLVSGAEQQVFAGPMRGFVLSPDGRFLAVTPPTDAGSTPALPAIRVVPVAGGEPVSVSAGAPAGITRVIAWSADGRFILCARRTESGSELWRLPVSGGSAQNTGLKVSGTILKISAHPDGRRVAISTGGGSADIWAIQGLLATPR